ncbi:hypothetical protein SAICODRAFT_30365 [Saitoella complicata NRRL Y-17804]|uniref:SAP domain-containing protein n=1 Tax=Saitoella complicata (strain BCRC 22490 / CBS 7301 / JCM 7358 / NBRC 10748 / NRRL Y-17804) TaxID=698492 RepID=A0A0E9NF17_SAICN|nr:uncharacterized protein SAICODRAFT_30365 [Saitoella complicata NRRL Y-17804]ODQ52924.1 hypothetical protein SAICODRAFT_30365 [Saitoella complicata NRRL Y-17804]GAO48452.1 hypothetical protein G7K_2625-t1 [Saitoella complicata NRRL Y-17804]
MFRSIRVAKSASSLRAQFLHSTSSNPAPSVTLLSAAQQNVNKSNQWASKTVAELRLELKKRGLKNSGKKSELVERLFSSDAATASATPIAKPAPAVAEKFPNVTKRHASSKASDTKQPMDANKVTIPAADIPAPTEDVIAEQQFDAQANIPITPTTIREAPKAPKAPELTVAKPEVHVVDDSAGADVAQLAGEVEQPVNKQEGVGSVREAVEAAKDKAHAGVNKLTEEVPEKVKENVGSVAEQVKEKAQQAPKKVQESAGSVVDKVKEQAEQVKEKAQEAPSKVQETAGSVVDKVKGQAEQVKEKAQQAPKKVQEAAGSVVDKVKEQAEQVKEKAQEAPKRVQEAAGTVVDKVKKQAQQVKEKVSEKVADASSSEAPEGEISGRDKTILWTLFGGILGWTLYGDKLTKKSKKEEEGKH